MKALLFILLLLLVPLGAAQAEDSAVVLASDLHYLSPQMVDDRNAFMRLVEAADGKVTHYTPQLMQAFEAEMLALRPRAVILSGDLTLNGDFPSHEELMVYLRRLQEAGIAVLVIPGNHDSTGEAYAFGQGGPQPVEGMDDTGFIAAYEAFGFAQARARDTVSFSYVYELSPTQWVLMLDVNANDTYGMVRNETLAWIEEQLLAAQAAGAQVISVTHQNLMVHHRAFTFGYQIVNAGALTSLYSRFGVQLNLSGHMHLQHLVQKDGITDIATSALPVFPNQYAVISWQDGALRYDTRQLNMAAWAARSGITDENLLSFAAYAQAFFDSNTRGKQTRALQALEGVDAGTLDAMVEYAVALNRRIFAGTGTQDMDHSPLALWQQHAPRSFFTYYMQSVVEAAAPDMNHFVLPAPGE